MAVDFSALQQNDFWKKKFRRACEVRDTNGDGYISRADFVQMVDRLKTLNVSTPRHIERYTQYLKKASDFFSLVDDSVKFTIEDFQEKWIAGMKKWVESGTIQDWFGSMFDVLDIDEDGFISFEEWTAHYHALSIDTAHARASFDALDVNHDQKIAKDEFVKYHIEYFLSVDNKMNSAILFGPLE